VFTPIVGEGVPAELRERILRLGVLKATTHTPPYNMHKYWARRSWKVFRRLIELFTRPGDVILDPFAGGGVTLVEGLIARRKVVAVDLNPLAVKIMRHEVAPLDTRLYMEAVKKLSEVAEPLASELYSVKCPRCGGKAVALWTEYSWSSDTPLAIRYRCNRCRREDTKQPEPGDLPEPPQLPQFRRVALPTGHSARGLVRAGIKYFDQLFTARNLYMVLRLKEEIEKLGSYGDDVKSFLLFTLSSTLKWASKLSHTRYSKVYEDEVLEGWAMHAYHIYPRYLEVNVWKQFLNRAEAVVKGKEYTNKHIGSYAREAKSFEELKSGTATYMILQADSRKLPVPSESVDAVITDPPYGGNVDYSGLSDYFLWLFGETAPKAEEVVINEARGLTIQHYQRGLEEVFKECYRVLKPGGPLTSTFNSKDARVLAAFMYSARRAGFRFAGAVPQPHLEAYETTFHAMKAGAMTYDYVFIFYKGDSIPEQEKPPQLAELRKTITAELEACRSRGCTERDFRARVYPELIKFLARADRAGEVVLAAEAVEDAVKANEELFKKAERGKDATLLDWLQPYE